MSPPMMSKPLCLAALLLGLMSDASAQLFSNVTNIDHLSGGVNATNFFKSPSEVLSVPLRRVDHHRGGVVTPSIARRFFKTDILGVYGAAYMAELSIGTSSNPQIVDVLIDTGSFELWVNPDCAASNVPDFCNAFGHYDPRRSPSAQRLGGDFKIEYGSGSAEGTYYKDDLYISGAKVESQQFGVANKSDMVWFGIMGLGHGLGNGFINYPLVIDSLAAQGLTNSKLFSLDLGAQANPGAAVTGQIVFGGVDTNKYSGFLGKVPTDPSDPHYKITLNSLFHRPDASSPPTPLLDSNLPLPVVLDSGTTLSLLPESVVSALAARFPGATPDGDGGYTVPCSLQETGEGSVDFDFLSPGGGRGNSTGSRVTISVSYRDFIWKSGDGADAKCFLGAVHAEDIGVWILGDTFLRGAYVSFDQTNNALYMSNYRTCGQGPNLVAVPAGPDAAAQIPGSCPEPEPAASADPAVSSTAGVPDPGVSRIDTDPTSTTTTTTTPHVTVTSTITRSVEYTVTACPGCEGQVGRVVTSFETVITTFCPGHPAAATPSPAATRNLGAGEGLVPESSAPVGSLAMAVATSTTVAQDESEAPSPEPAPEQGVVDLLVVQQQPQPEPEPEPAAQIQQPPPSPSPSAAPPAVQIQAAEEEQEQEQELTITLTTSRCTTSTGTFAVSTCVSSLCSTLDETTTRVITIIETVLQLQKISTRTSTTTATSPPPPSFPFIPASSIPFSEYRTPRVTPGGGFFPSHVPGGGYGNHSSAGGGIAHMTGLANLVEVSVSSTPPRRPTHTPIPPAAEVASPPAALPPGGDSNKPFTGTAAAVGTASGKGWYCFLSLLAICAWPGLW
ncbi:aspartic peptidase domain-containing protein [Biscogniauxia mediterranea]|nr:aspartic peptidase domain-containing protein [Biscogniauxia mediterranea]